MLWNILIITLLVAVTIFALYRAGKQVKNPCAGCSGCTPIKAQEKKLDGNIVKVKNYKVKGMTCPNCYAIAETSVNKINGLLATVNGKKNLLSVKGVRDFSDEEISEALMKSGFEIEQ